MEGDSDPMACSDSQMKTKKAGQRPNASASFSCLLFFYFRSAGSLFGRHHHHHHCPMCLTIICLRRRSAPTPTPAPAPSVSLCSCFRSASSFPFVQVCLYIFHQPLLVFSGSTSYPSPSPHYKGSIKPSREKQASTLPRPPKTRQQ